MTSLSYTYYFRVNRNNDRINTPVYIITAILMQNIAQVFFLTICGFIRWGHNAPLTSYDITHYSSAWQCWKGKITLYGNVRRLREVTQVCQYVLEETYFSSRLYDCLFYIWLLYFFIFFLSRNKNRVNNIYNGSCTEWKCLFWKKKTIKPLVSLLQCFFVVMLISKKKIIMHYFRR